MTDIFSKILMDEAIDGLIGSFDWASSSEGKQYWKKIHERLKEIRDEKKDVSIILTRKEAEHLSHLIEVEGCGCMASIKQKAKDALGD